MAVEFDCGSYSPVFDVAWRGNCVCTAEWCLCPGVGSLYAEIGGVPVRAYKR